MAEFNIKINGLKEFERAVKRHPQETRDELQKFFSRAEAKLKSRIRNKPWKLGQSGGGAPVLTGNLRDGLVGAGRAPGAEVSHRKPDGVGHIYERKAMSLRIYPTASYAKYIHDGNFGRQKRPWLDHALEKETPDIRKLEKDLLKTIVSNLAK